MIDHITLFFLLFLQLIIIILLIKLFWQKQIQIKQLVIENKNTLDGLEKLLADYANKLREKKDYCELIINSLPLAIITFDENGIVECVNQAVTLLTGYSKEEIKSIYQNIEQLSEKSEKFFWQTLQSGNRFLGYENYCPTKSGKEIPVITTTKVLYTHNGEKRGLVSTICDVSDYLKLQNSNKMANLILDHLADAVISVDENGNINYFNKTAEKMSGLLREEVIDKNYEEIFIHQNTPFTKLTYTLFREEELTNHQKVIQQVEDQYHWLITTRVLLDENGKKIGAIAIYRDITKLKEMEEHLKQAEKLKVVGELAAGTAHEIRNPLTAIRGFAQLMKKNFNDDSKEYKYLQVIEDETRRINEIIREMLMLAKPLGFSLVKAELQEIIIETLNLMQSEAILRNVNIETNFLPFSLSVNVDIPHIKQIFVNIIKNGIEAMPFGGKLTIKTNIDKITEKAYAKVTIIDQGIGIPKENLGKIFDPFFTTKEGGTGLGMSVTYQIIKQHNGIIKVDSELGKGTVVNVLIPLI